MLDRRLEGWGSLVLVGGGTSERLTNGPRGPIVCMFHTKAALPHQPRKCRGHTAPYAGGWRCAHSLSELKASGDFGGFCRQPSIVCHRTTAETTKSRYE